MELVTFNADAGIWATTRIEFVFKDGGTIEATTSIYTSRVELYSQPLDGFRRAAAAACTPAFQPF